VLVQDLLLILAAVSLHLGLELSHFLHLQLLGFSLDQHFAVGDCAQLHPHFGLPLQPFFQFLLGLNQGHALTLAQRVNQCVLCLQLHVPLQRSVVFNLTLIALERLHALLALKQLAEPL